MDVKPGYKMTEVGVIPEEWQSIQLAQLGLFTKGQGIRKDEASSGSIPCVRYGEIYTHHNEIIRTYNSFISATVAKTSKRLTQGDILFACSGETKQEIGKAVAFIDESEVYAGGDIVILSPKSVNSQFLGYALNSAQVNRLKASRGQGDAVVHISSSAIRAIALAIPPLPEQRAIASALSDVDALIESLDAVIAKKRDIKQATMQQLLTGVTRLPGFEGEWEVKRLGELGRTYGGLTAKTKDDFGYGEAQYITFLNVMTNVVVDCNIFENVRVSASECQNRVLKGDLLFNGSSETPDEIAMCCLMLEVVENLYLNSFCFGFRLHNDQDVDGLFLSYYLRAQPGRELLKALSQGSTRYNLSKISFLNALIRLPSKSEQTAIATVLSDMDAEIEALEARRDKTKLLKQGMMQELLTGMTRLV
ncbi:MAG: restriction endonuclease subunit S [Candidatus Kapabacteria bacterium]|nr:restriction endonuclease subunit S [Candidatus Kapabacteria bacterium]